MNLSRIIEDGYEVAEFLRGHLHTDKVILLGHSSNHSDVRRPPECTTDGSR